jgi:hypothetical protein
VRFLYGLIQSTYLTGSHTEFRSERLVDLDLRWYSMSKDWLANGSADLYDTGMQDGKVRNNRNFRQKRAHAARPSAPFELPCSTHHICELNASSDRVSTLSVCYESRHCGKKAAPSPIDPPRLDKMHSSVGRRGHRTRFRCRSNRVEHAGARSAVNDRRMTHLSGRGERY